MDELKPCPFCGRRESSFVKTFSIDSCASIACPCGVVMKAVEKPECYELIEGNIYRKHEAVPAYEMVKTAWNRRVNDG